MGTSLPSLQPTTQARMKFFIAIVSALLAIALAAPAPEAEAEADAEAKNVNSKHFFGGYGYNGYSLLGAGYHYPSYGHYPSYTYPSYGHYQGGYYGGYNGYRPCYGYACILRNKNKNQIMNQHNNEFTL